MPDKRQRDDFDRWFKNQAAKGDSPIIHAATVVVLREASPDTDSVASSGVEVLMMRKNPDVTFGGAWVFPGGKLDPEDYAPGDEDPYNAAATAAVREAEEEGDIVLAAQDLVRYSHWMPPASAPKRFATWFFLAGVEVGDVTIDDGEITAHQWVLPSAMLDKHVTREVDLAPPTWVTLHNLAQHRSVESALDAARTADPELFVTRIGRGDHGIAAMWTGDAGYESGELNADGARHRLWMHKTGAWQFERT